MALTDKETANQGDELYEQYGKPLEAEHWGEFIAISPDGRTLLGTEMVEVSDEGAEGIWWRRAYIQGRANSNRTNSLARHGGNNIERRKRRFER